MKKTLVVILAVAVWVSSPARAQVQVTGFGSTDLNPLDTSSDFLSPWTGTQTTTSVSVSSVSNSAGGIFSDLSTPINITTGIADLDLTGQLTSATPTTNEFQLQLFDSSFNSVSYDFNWSSFTTDSTIIAPLAITSGIFNGTVTSYSLNLFGQGADSVDTVSFRFENLAAGIAVPEPSTSALLLAGLMLAGAYRWRSRRA